MSEYTAIVEVAVNGRVISDLKSFSEDPRRLRKPVELMNKTGSTKVTPRYTFEMEYVIPAVGKFDWDSVEDATVTVTDEAGGVIRFTGVDVLEVGGTKADGENEKASTIKFKASTRTEE